MSVPALAQGAAGADSVAAAPAVEYRVGAVRVRGNAHTDSVRIVRTFEVLSGTRLSLIHI